MMVGTGTGVIRAIYCKPDVKSDVVPVDGVINMIICAAWRTAKQHAANPEMGKSAPVVYNYTSGTMKSHCWNDVLVGSMETWNKFPLERGIFRYPKAFMFPSHFTYKIQAFFRHSLPGQVSDYILQIRGQKPRMASAYRKLDRCMSDYKHFMHNEWEWKIDNVDACTSEMSEHDQKLFGFDLRDIHWRSYYGAAALGIKKYLMQEDMGRVGVARRSARRMQTISLVMRAVILWILFKLLIPMLRSRGMTKSVWLAFAPILIAAGRK
jgi:fatty acyl-CoA reductase